jgi:hypothetical protein
LFPDPDAPPHARHQKVNPGGGGGGSIYIGYGTTTAPTGGGGGGGTPPGGGGGTPPGGVSHFPSFQPPSSRAAGLPAFGDIERGRGFDLERLRRRAPAPAAKSSAFPSRAGHEFRVPGGFQLPPEMEFARRLERPRFEAGLGETPTDPLVRFLRGLVKLVLPP